MLKNFRLNETAKKIDDCGICQCKSFFEIKCIWQITFNFKMTKFLRFVKVLIAKAASDYH